jgi:DNA-binding transcriptional MocR family regulator
MLAASPANIEMTQRAMSVQTIGHDKVNQLRHLRMLADPAAVRKQMGRHAEIIREKFAILEATLERDLGGLGIAEWTHPKGGYFVSLDVMDGTAKRVYELARDAGVTLTTVGATFPYGKDPDDRNLRLAPTYPTCEELELAADVLTVSVRLAAIERLLSA